MKNEVTIKLRQFLKERRGSVFVELVVKFMVITVMLLFILEVFAVVMQYQDITYIAKTVTRVVEQEGALNNTGYEMLNKLNENMGTDAELEISNVRYFNNLEKTIQFRNTFVISISDSYSLKILSPIFVKNPLVIDIPMTASITGMSEVYWK